jgi:hypothetical protein
MRKLHVLLLGVVMLSAGFVLPVEVRADDCHDDVFDVYAKYARKIVSVTFRGTDVMDEVVEAAVPRIRRLQNAGEHRHARAVAARAIDAIQSLGDKTHGAIRDTTTEGVRALMQFEGDVRPEVLRELIGNLLQLAQRAANYVSDVEEDSINAIERLFPQVSEAPIRERS